MLKKMSFFIMLSVCLVLAACQSNGKAEASFTGTIVEINNQSALVSIESGEILRSGDKVAVDLSQNQDVDFQVGDKVKVGYDGTVRESYPLGINVTYVELIEHVDKNKEIVLEKQEGDFVLKFVTEKDVYVPHEKSNIYVQVKYIGPEDEKIIEHGGFSPVKFEVEEKNRGIAIPATEPMILSQTTFKKEEWYTFPFEKSGELKEDEFYQDYFEKEGFPKGNYIIAAIFTFMSDESDKYSISDGSAIIDIGRMEIKVE